ncbi:MAG: transcriptional regulator, LacI family [Actinomycetia bacterium]|nr:transcriptional regulator, LacI family [Actinomycetes bacterium]
MSRVSIRDVAEAAGVSQTTVSHVLNDVDGARVAEETRSRVRQAAERLRYSPSRAARGLRLQRTNAVAMLSDHIATTPHAGKIILGAQETAHARGWTLLLFNTGADRELEDRDLDALIQHQVEGVLYASMYHRRVDVPSRLVGTPVVLLDARSDDASLPAVVPDEVEGGRVAVEELISFGHRRIGFATNRDDIPATSGRLAGYREALKAGDIPFDRSLVIADESEAGGGYRAVSKLLRRDPRPTAIFCFNDRMAMGAYRAAAELGLRIPDDLSIIGFDNQEIIADGLFPALTTVALPHFEMGCWAVDSLIRLIESPDSAPTGPFPTLISCPIVRRESVAAPTTSGLD